MNAYEDERSIKTSLLEGAVQVKDKILKPGEAYMNGDVIKTDVEEDVAWRFGAFRFSDADLSSVFRQLSRWYDIEVIYKASAPSVRFSGEMSRNLQLSQVVKILNKMHVRCKIEGSKQLIVY